MKTGYSTFPASLTDGSATTKLPGSPYAPLDASQREIRLLELIPGDHDSDLILNLRVHALEDENVCYTTLSYVWGEELCPRPALINGMQVRIRRNLDCALRHIRDNITDLLESSLLWADALCIDQTDLGERNHQVGLMGRIYSSAVDMVIWLGPERRDTAFILESIRKGKIPDSTKMVKILEPLTRLCRRRWFGRLWIAQELALSKDPIVLIGHHSLRWQIFHSFVSRINSRIEPVACGDSAEWPFDVCSHFSEAAKRVTNLHAIKYDSDGSMLELLYRTRALLASDPRDKVYGLLNIRKSLSAHIIISPDYSKGVQRVFAEATFAMLLEVFCPYATFPLQPLFKAAPGQRTTPTRIAGLPSWALDLTIGANGPFSNSSTFCYPFMFYDREGVECLQIASKLSAHIKVDDQFLRLSIIGKHLGTIVGTTGSLFDTEGQDIILNPPILHAAYLVVNRARQISTEAFTQAVCSESWTDPETISRLAQLLHGTIGPEDEYVPSDEYISRANKIYYHRDNVVFVTAEGHVGKAYHPEFGNGIRAGDVVVGLFGINLPFILRKVHAEDRQESVYTMVNIAYITNHKWSHDFIKSVPDDADLTYFQQRGLQNYTIV